MVTPAHQPDNRLPETLQQPIDGLLEHVWLSEQLAHNSLEGYRHDLSKVAHRLHAAGLDWLSVGSVDLAAAVFVPNEKPGTQARALSACKRLFGWLQEYGHRPDLPTEHLHNPKQGRALPAIISEAVARCEAPELRLHRRPHQSAWPAAPRRFRGACNQ